MLEIENRYMRTSLFEHLAFFICEMSEIGNSVLAELQSDIGHRIFGILFLNAKSESQKSKIGSRNMCSL